MLLCCPISPSFVLQANVIKSKGYDIACTAVNDADVMEAWANSQNAKGKITFLGAPFPPPPFPPPPFPLPPSALFRNFRSFFFLFLVIRRLHQSTYSAVTGSSSSSS